MGKILDMLKQLWAKFKSLGRKIKISIIVAVIATLVALISLVVFTTRTNYEVLYSNLDSDDATAIMTTLDDNGTTYKVEGNSILVPEKEVDKLRLDLASNLSSSSKGYELMDDTSSFGMTDEEFAIKKVRMVEGELEKSIKSLDAVESASVHINAAEDSVFSKSSTEGSAAVILSLKSGTQITDDQVKSIVSMVSASTENIPKENIEVIDTNMNLLTANLTYDDSEDGTVSSSSIQDKKDMEEAEGDKFAKVIVDLLEPVLGSGKVSATVNVDLDFDSTQKTTTTIDPNKVIVSQQTSTEKSGSSTDATSESPVDENMSATIAEDNDDGSSTYTKEEQTTNYDSSKTESTTITSPGEIKRMTASIFIDGDIDEATRTQLQQSVASAIGINNSRGDEITLVGMNFDTTDSEATQAQVDAFNEELAQTKRNKIIMYAVLGGVGLIALIIILVVIRKKRNEDEEDDEDEDRLLDVVVNDQGIDDTMQYSPINFEVNNKQAHIENEIKDYAKEKPDQVADIVKSWLSDNER